MLGMGSLVHLKGLPVTRLNLVIRDAMLRQRVEQAATVKMSTDRQAYSRRDPTLPGASWHDQRNRKQQRKMVCQDRKRSRNPQLIKRRIPQDMDEPPNAKGYINLRERADSSR